MKRSKNFSGILSFLIALVLAVLFLIPFYFVVVNSIKSFGEILSSSASLPQKFMFSNYSKAWELLNFSHAFLNSLVITVFSLIGIVLFGSMTAYQLVRFKSRFNNILFYVFVSSLVIPLQSIMIPLVKVVKEFGIINHQSGLIICYFGFGVSFAIFLFHGFIKSIPIEIESAAIIDGCSRYGVFCRIVLPLLKPILITVIMIDTLWIWNDFLLPLLILHSSELHTIPLSTMKLFSEYTKQWDLALAALVLGLIPIFIFFLFMQRYIVDGITAGSVKG